MFVITFNFKQKVPYLDFRFLIPKRRVLFVFWHRIIEPIWVRFFAFGFGFVHHGGSLQFPEKQIIISVKKASLNWYFPYFSQNYFEGLF